jgi:hypothetical protein
VVTAAEAKWSSDQSFSNVISMINIGADAYKTGSQIPAQSKGTTVYYKVCAEDSRGDNGCSQVFTISMDFPSYFQQLADKIRQDLDLLIKTIMKKIYQLLDFLSKII